MESYTWYNGLVIIFACFGSLFAGYGLAIIGPTIGQPTFYTSLGLAAVAGEPGYAHTTVFLGASNGVFFGAGFLGTLVAGSTAEKFGRLNGFRIAAATGIVGGILQTASVNQAMFLVARAVTGIASGHTLGAMPTYYAEVAPPHSRGLMAGAHGVFINIGYFLSGWIDVGCYFASETTLGWRLPNGFLNLWALCLLAGTLYVPESPRWLVSRGRYKEALDILRKLHHDRNDPADTFAHRELALIRQQQETEHVEFKRDGRWQLLTKTTYRKRLILAVLLMMGGQNVGILVVNNFNVLLYQSLGLSNDISLVVSAAWNTTCVVANIMGAYFSDKLGRRKALLIGFTCCTANLAISTGLIAKYSDTPNKQLAGAATCFLFLYGFFYGSMIDCHQFVVAAEIFPTHLRSEASAFAIGGIFLVDTLWLCLQPTALEAIGWKYYLVFLCLGAVHTIHLYVFLPETAGKALEEIDDVFGKVAIAHLDDANLGEGVGRDDDSPSKKVGQEIQDIVP